MVEYNDGYGNIYDPMEEYTNRVVKKHFYKPKMVWDWQKIILIIYTIIMAIVLINSISEYFIRTFLTLINHE